MFRDFLPGFGCCDLLLKMFTSRSRQNIVFIFYTYAILKLCKLSLTIHELDLDFIYYLFTYSYTAMPYYSNFT